MQEIADRYARCNGFDTAEYVAVKNGFAYFLLKWNPRPKYTGHPNVIKISQTGAIHVLTDREEIYWAVGQPKDSCQDSKTTPISDSIVPYDVVKNYSELRNIITIE